MSKKSGQHPVLHDYGTHYRTPMSIIEALDDARAEMNYSNFHCGLFEKAQKIVRLWAKAEGIPLGPTRKDREEAQANQMENLIEDIYERFRQLGLNPEDYVKDLK